MTSPSPKKAPRRKRALTIPLSNPAIILWRRQKSTNQSQSILFKKLPREVRDLIYEWTCYFPHHTGITVYPKSSDVHIFSRSGRLFWRRCSSRDGSCTPHCYRKYYGYTPFSLSLLAVVLTCRRVYSEAINLLYSRNTFVFRNLTTITLFTSAILPQRLNRIQSLRLEWIFRDYDMELAHPVGVVKARLKRWEALWEILGRMSGLRKLHVKIGGDFLERPAREWEEQIFEPMRRVEGLRVFEVEVDWLVKVSSTIGPFHRVDVVSKLSDESLYED